MIYLGLELQKREFRHYLGGLLGESERKNVSQMAPDSVVVTTHLYDGKKSSLGLKEYQVRSKRSLKRHFI